MRFFFLLWIVPAFAAFNLTWGIPAVSLDPIPPLGDTDAHPSVAVSPNGDSIAVWTRTAGKGATENIWIATYHHTPRVWSGALQISRAGNSTHPRIAIDERGIALFVWEEGFPTQIVSRTLSSDGLWSPPLDEPPLPIYESSSTQSSPEIALDGEGRAMVLWRELSQNLYHIHAAQRALDGSWHPLAKLSSPDKTARLNPHKSLQLNETGEGIAAWEEHSLEGIEIRAAQYTKGAWQSSLPLSALGEGRAEAPVVGIDAQGKAMIVWSQNDQILSRTLFQETLSSLSTASDPHHPAKRPDLALDAAGNAVLVFERFDAIHKFIVGATFPADGKEWLPPTDISGPSPLAIDAAGYPVLSLNRRGDGTAIWKEFTDSHLMLQSAGYSLGTWSYIKTLSHSEDDVGAPFPTHDIDVAINTAGHLIAIWPESPTHFSSQQIKATTGIGLANPAPMPPLRAVETIQNGIAYGKQIIHRFPAHADLINILEWTPQSDAIEYRVYRGSFSNLIGTSREPRFEDHQRVPFRQEIYLITSLDSNQQESSPITLVVPPLEIIPKKKKR